MFPSQQPQQPPRTKEEQDKQFWQDFYRSTPHSNVWVRWEYGPEDWALFDTVDYQPKRRVLISLLCGLLAGLPFSLPFLFTPGGWVIGIQAAFGIGALVALLIWAMSRRGPRRRQIARQKPGQPHRVVLPRKGCG